MEELSAFFAAKPVFIVIHPAHLANKNISFTDKKIVILRK